ncbi:MAG: SurA N-terminal domain-containing protein [Spirochaetes bacterium]|nr:SurA N-terminal domain-containing protein [Spirochaetota bacterium]
MKSRIIVSTSVCLFAIVSLLGSCSKYGGEWVAKIDSDTITIDELNTFYYAQQKSLYNLPKEKIDELAADPAQVAKNPTLNKQEFLEQLIRQRLVYKKAMSDGTGKDDEVEALMQMAEEAVVVGFYVREKFKNEIEPTAEEVENIYRQQGARFKGVPADQAEMYIKQQLQQQKLQIKIRDMVEALRDEKGIKKNTEFLKKEQHKAEKKTEAPAGK